MESLLHSELQNRRAPTLARQALSYLLHTLLALVSWIALMLVGYAVNPEGISQGVVFLLSLAAPLAVGFVVVKIWPDEMATIVWLVGFIWLMIVGLYVLDLPTGPDRCFHCGATEKLSRTFFSLPKPSGLMDDDGPFIGTWPAAAMLGYSIGSRLAMRRHREP